MNRWLLSLLVMGWVTSCTGKPDEAVPGDGGVCPPVADLAPTKPKCEAAKGLAGDNLFCIDFSSVGDQPLDSPPPTKLSGWDFTNNCGGKYWAISKGKLQINNFSGFASNCGFLMPAVNPSDYQKYNSFTLSVVHTVDLNQQKQTAWIYLGSMVASQQLAQSTGTNPRQRNIYEVAKTDLPNGGTNTYQPLFQIISTLAGGATGWQIESIAVMGNTQ